MKKNRMGFTLLETLIVSTFIASTLIYLFIQITNIKTSYDITFRYDTVPGLYGAQSMVQYLNSNTYEEVKTNLKSSDLHYIDLTDGTALSNGSNLYYKDLINKLDIKMMIFIKEDTSEILTNLDNITVFSEEMKKFIRKIDSSKIENLYRLVIEYNDNTFASVKIGTGTEPVCEFAIGQTWEYDYTGTEQEFSVPCSGTYKLETWGAQGGSISGYSGGYGGSSSGTITLKKETNLHIVIGGSGTGATGIGASLSGGYNGGGSVTGNPNVNHICASGGGATHIATRAGILATLSSYRTDILIVAGGGGGARNQANHVADARWGNGGSGGGLNGGGAISSYGSTSSYTTVNENAGTQTSGYAFGQGQSNTANSGGGAGWFGGYSGGGGIGYTGSGSGGSGYIDGVTNGVSIAGVRAGNGYAKITLVNY